MGAPVDVRFEETSWTVTAEQIGAKPDETGAVESAMAVGRSGGITAVSDRFLAWFRPVDVEVPVSSDATQTEAFLGTIAAEVDRAPTDASVSIEGTAATLLPSEVGVAIRRERVREEILAALIVTSAPLW